MPLASDAPGRLDSDRPLTVAVPVPLHHYPAPPRPQEPTEGPAKMVEAATCQVRIHT